MQHQTLTGGFKQPWMVQMYGLKLKVKHVMTQTKVQLLLNNQLFGFLPVLLLAPSIVVEFGI